MPRGTEREGQVTQGQPGLASQSNQQDAYDAPMATIAKRIQKRKRKAPKTPQAVIEADEGNEQAYGSRDLKTMIERRMADVKRKRQQAALEKQLLEVGSGDSLVHTPASGINGAQPSLYLGLGLDDQPKGDVGDAGLSNEHSAKEPLPLHGSGDVQNFSALDDEPTSMKDIEHDERENKSEQGSQHEDPMADQDHQSVQVATMHPPKTKMTAQEKKWWAMSFEELYQHAKSKNFGKTRKESSKSGRIRIIKWLCEKEGITPYVAPSITPKATPVIARPTLRPTGAISHPEAILRTSDPALQRLIDEGEKKYREWTADDLLALAKQRSYTLLKDSNGKLPSKSISAMANWHAAFDVLKSPREKKWWLGDGIDLCNKAKAMGYQGPSKKYDVIVWLRSTPEDSEADVTGIAFPTPNRNPAKLTAEEAAQYVSNRPAKGSKRPHGWKSQWDVLKRP
jgi:hypothetical protein